MRLDAVGVLTEDGILDVMTGFTICSTAASRKLFDTMIQNETFDNFGVLTTITNSSTNMEKIKAIFVKATYTYDMFAASGR